MFSDMSPNRSSLRLEKTSTICIRKEVAEYDKNSGNDVRYDHAHGDSFLFINNPPPSPNPVPKGERLLLKKDWLTCVPFKDCLATHHTNQ